MIDEQNSLMCKESKIKCRKEGGIRFTIDGLGIFISVLINNVVGAGDIAAIKIRGTKTGWLPMGMKVYLTNEKELIMELSMKWARNPNIIVGAKAFGLRATVQPHVDFGLKILGADAMSIPGLYRFVQELIKDQVANMYLWPKYLEVPILDPSKAAKKPIRILNVKVMKGIKLKKNDLLGKSDPYVKLKLTEDKLSTKKTTVKHNNLNPEWNEKFSLVVKDPES